MHPRLAESVICLQQPLVLLALDHVLPRIPGLCYIARLTIGGCFTTMDCRAASAAGVVATVTRQAAAQAKLIAVLMIITVALLRSPRPIAA